MSERVLNIISEVNFLMGIDKTHKNSSVLFSPSRDLISLFSSLFYNLSYLAAKLLATVKSLHILPLEFTVFIQTW